jgi:DMSO/TMAO reductase YedYZ molybdopterin-dependent catalytic subunit
LVRIIMEVYVPMKRNITLALLALVISLVAMACGSSTPKVDWQIEITGAVSNPLTISYEELTKRDMIVLKDVLMRRSQGEDTTSTWEGPALMPILQEAGISANAEAVVFTAADGYAREMVVAELQDAIIALKEDGEWIAQGGDNPLRLIVPDKPANHWISHLVEIDVVE